MSISALLVDARAAHLALMIDTCVIERQAAGTFNTSTGDYDSASWATIYSGACRVKGPHAGAITTTEKFAGEAEQSTQRQTLVLPHGSEDDIRMGDRVTVTGSNEDTTFRVVGQVDTTTMTARSILIEKIEAPGGS